MEDYVSISAHSLSIFSEYTPDSSRGDAILADVHDLIGRDVEARLEEMFGEFGRVVLCAARARLRERIAQGDHLLFPNLGLEDRFHASLLYQLQIIEETTSGTYRIEAARNAVELYISLLCDMFGHLG